MKCNAVDSNYSILRVAFSGDRQHQKPMSFGLTIYFFEDIVETFSVIGIGKYHFRLRAIRRSPLFFLLFLDLAHESPVVGAFFREDLRTDAAASNGGSWSQSGHNWTQGSLIWLIKVLSVRGSISELFQASLIHPREN